ncbi:MAG: hypothetical protein KJ888_20420 [Gammaproteobacteria bacterium]|nr:hypothetical protein [Gammaproteobacteria bacterium]
MSIKRQVEEILNSKREARYLIHDSDRALLKLIQDYQGTLMEALEIGLVKLNFKAPTGFYINLRKGEQNDRDQA